MMMEIVMMEMMEMMEMIHDDGGSMMEHSDDDVVETTDIELVRQSRMTAAHTAAWSRIQ